MGISFYCDFITEEFPRYTNLEMFGIAELCLLCQIKKKIENILHIDPITFLGLF